LCRKDLEKFVKEVPNPEEKLVGGNKGEMKKEILC
jgi:hypothetical protein